MRRPALVLIIALLGTFAVPPAVAKGPRLKVTQAGPSATSPFRVVFRPDFVLSASADERVVVRADWRGGRPRGCDRFASDSVQRIRRGAWKAVRLVANTPRRRPRWCAGTWVIRVMVAGYDSCDGDEVCRDEGDYENEWRRVTRRVVAR